MRWIVGAIMVGMVAASSRLEAVDNIATNSGYWTNAAIWSAGGIPASGHDVVIPAGITVTNTGLATTFINSLTITGSLTHAANASTETHKLILDLAGNLTIASGGKIDVSEKGYVFGGSGQAPLGTVGGGNQRGGNGHGGEGGTSGTWGPGGSVYGSVTNPLALGSGNSMAGGGAVRLQVGGAMTNNGAISANGRNGADGVTSGGGAGGSIHIVAGSLAGTGTVTAAGGLGSTGWTMGGGAGGRIAVVLTNGTFGAFPVTNITAIGGSVNFTDGSGAAGTVWLKDTNQTYGTLVVRNFTTVYQTAARTPLTNGTFRFDGIVVTNRGALAVGTNATLDLTGCALSGDNNTGAAGLNIGGRIVFGLPGGAIVWPNPFTNTVTFSQVGTNLFTIGADVALAAGGMFTHELNATNEAHKLNVKIVGALTVNSNGAINVAQCGYAACGATATNGPGDPPAVGNRRGGAGHGGQGGRGSVWGHPGGTTYGSVTNPIALGSGGALTRGGGAAIVQVTGALIHNGTLTAAGANRSSGYTGGAAGGSINLTAATLSGGGTISAGGGTGESGWDLGGGGGGRIAMSLTGGDFSAFPLTNITAFGGNVVSGGDSEEPGAAGTVYLKTGSQTYGTLIVANSNLTTAAWTLLTNVTCRFDGITVTNRGMLAVGTNATLDLTGCALSGDNNTAVAGTGIRGRIGFGLPGGTIVWPTSFTNAATLSQVGTNLFTIGADVTLAAGGMFTHELNATKEAHKLNVKIVGALTVNSNGAINVAQCGYAACGATATNGPGDPPAVGSRRGGAGHGGQGGRGENWADPGGTTYGSVITPNTLGSASALTRGGGAAIMQVAGAMTLNGTIAADGEGCGAGGRASGAGAGGSINVTAATLSGSGSITARGGAGADGWDMGGGGGGRVAVMLTGGDFSAFPVTNISANGGANTAGTGEEPGAAGTVYLQAAAQGAGRGAVIMNNNNATTAARTHLPPASHVDPNEWRYVSITVTNRGALAITTNVTVQSLAVVSANEPLNLGASNTVLTVKALRVNGVDYPRGGLYTTNNWNSYTPVPANVAGAGAILIRAGGTVLMIK
jgi:hypothetical protein